ncbi:MAG: alpha/beta hydrolase [Stappiaceae bacterium]
MSQVLSSERFITDDGVTLHYLEAGRKHTNGPVLVFLPGWTLSASGFRHQLSGLSNHYRCVALDYRSHGLSECPDHGYRVSRFAQDVNNLLSHAQIEQAVFVAHSAGCAVAWSFLELFGQERLKALVLCDQMIARLKRPGWTEEQCRQFGASVGGDQAVTEAQTLSGPEGTETMRSFLESMFTPRCPAGDRSGIIESSLNVPRNNAVRLLLDVTFSDYRDLLPKINLPTLCIGGHASHLGPDVMPYIASQIPRATLKMISVEEGGSHFMFAENPPLFNEWLSAFLHSQLSR